MQLLSSIADLKDIVNKEYIDSILANYVLSANLGALATKDSLAFSDLTSRPSKLSDFTDDVVAGKYLPLSGGTISGTDFQPLVVNSTWSGNSQDVRIALSHAGAIKGLINWNSTTGFRLYNNINGASLGIKDDGTPHYNGNTLYHAGNFNPANYLPLSGGTIEGRDDALKIKRTGSYLSSIGFYNSDGKLGSLGFVWGNAPAFFHTDDNYYLLIHSGNVGDYALKVDGSNGMGVSAYIQWTTSEYTEDYSAYGEGFRILKSNVSSGNYRGGIHVGARYGWQLTREAGSGVMQVRFNEAGESTRESWKTIAFTDSNVASATKLATARTIWGQSFDGTGNVSGTLKNVSWIELTGTNFGIYQGSALNSALTDNDIALYSQKVYMSGNVGIGTTNPQYELDVNGNIGTSGEVFLNHNKAIRMKGSNGTDYNVLFTSGTDLNIGYDSPVIRFGGSKMLINPSGNVTIGGSDLAGTSYALCVNGVNKFYDKDNTLKLYTKIKGCGVQIGRTTSAYTGGYNGGVTIGEDDSNLGFIAGAFNGSTGSSQILFHYGGSSQNDASIYIKGISGNVGIANANPAYKLDVAGSIRTTSSLTIGTIVLTDENGTLKIQGNAYTTGQLATGKAGQAASGGGSVQYWSNEYDMDIGTDVLVSSKEYIGTNTIVGWDLAGSCLNDLYIGYDGYTIWMQGSVDEASDMRLKTVIDAVNLDIKDIAYAPIFNYVFKSRPQGRQMLGSSAQYWQAIAPKAVSENDKGNLAMNYGAIALASVVAVAKKVVTHEEEIAELKSKVQSLETRLAKYELN